MHFHVLHKLIENCGRVAITHDNNKLSRLSNSNDHLSLFLVEIVKLHTVLTSYDCMILRTHWLISAGIILHGDPQSGVQQSDN